jgi:GNAT superfamily N-acetyltransferase
MMTAFDVMDHYKVDRFLSAQGLCVDSKFRGRGIATEILKARAPLMACIGLEVTSAIFSTLGAQKAALAAGYDWNYSIEFTELDKKVSGMDFSNGHGRSCQILSLKV